MKRQELLRHLSEHGCELLREGGAHTVYALFARPRRCHATVELNDFLCRKICDDLQIPRPGYI